MALSSALAMAHHSFAMFDMSKKVTRDGVVREWQWTNPHVFLEVAVLQNGAQQIYSLETGSPAVTLRRGLKRDSLKPGDKVTVVFCPLRDGRPGGALISVAKDGVSLTKDGVSLDSPLTPR
jgi:hypothetical protein